MTLKKYKSYSFTSQDPVIKEIKWIMGTENLTVANMTASSGVSDNTIRNWLKGKTKRPQHATVMATIRGAGYDMTVAKRGKNSQ